MLPRAIMHYWARMFLFKGTDDMVKKWRKQQKKQELIQSLLWIKSAMIIKRCGNCMILTIQTLFATTDERHKKAVYKWIETVEKKGDIYKAQYDGWYCVPDETFVTEQAVDGKAPLCPTCGRETIQLTEENYFFRLSAYQDRLLKFYKDNPDFITPRERLNEVISFVESGLKI
jgi:methionyl-tRNA synthetase